VFAPETANAITPYHVSPVDDVWTEMLSAVSGVEAMAYHVCMNWPPPMLSWPALAENVSPAVSFTEKDPPAGQQSHPTIMTSEGFAVVRVTEQEVTYPHPFLALPSSDIVEAAPTAAREAKYVPESNATRRGT
jgi:hypothetical protein